MTDPSSPTLTRSFTVPASLRARAADGYLGWGWSSATGAGAEGEGGTAPASAEAVCRASAPAIDGGRSVPALATPSGTIAPPPDGPCAAAGADAAGAVVPSEGEPAPGSVFAGKDGR